MRSGELVKITSPRVQALRASAVLLAAGIAIALSGCTGQAPSVSDAAIEQPRVNVITSAEAVEEYTSTIVAITEPLPKGEAYPEPVASNFVYTEDVLASGTGRSQAQFTWLCAWETNYLDAFADGKAKRVRAAEKMIAKWAHSEFYLATIDEPNHLWIVSVLDPMQAGDPSGVRAEHQSLCSQYPTTEVG